MKRLLIGAGLGMLMCLLFACDKKQDSPRIVCELDGQTVPTVFTFTEFKQTLASEHGQVEATGYEQLKTRSLTVFFKPLPNGTLLAERALILKSGTLMPPAILFGLTNAVPSAFQAPPLEEWISNGPQASNGSNPAARK